MKLSDNIDRPCLVKIGFTSCQLCFLKPLFRLFTQSCRISLLERIQLVIAWLHNTQHDVGQTTITDEPLSSSATSLLDKLNESNLKFDKFRRVIKEYQYTERSPDTEFIETMGNHFLNLCQSLLNPLLVPTLERTAATKTTIILLDNLFFSGNDKINFCWFEVETLLTRSTKWDGVGFNANSDKRISYCLVEFSGGIKKNNSNKKAGHDEEKIEAGVVKFMDFTDANKGHFVRYHDLKLYFELVFKIGDRLMRRTYAVVKFPTTPSDLKEFLNQTQRLFSWKKSLIHSITI